MNGKNHRYIIFAIIWAITLGVWAGEMFGQVRQSSKDHYAKLLLLEAKPEPGYEKLDSMTFPLSDWGPLMSWKLLRTYYATKPFEKFPSLGVPANSSKRTRAELDYLQDLQRTRTREELAWSLKLASIYYNPMIVNPADKQYVANRENLFYLGRSLGGWFRREELPLTEDLLSKVVHDATVYIVDFKLKYARPRPYVLEPALKVDQPLPHGAFPSGHSFTSYVNAEILIRLAPDRKDDLLNAAHEFAWSRELLGVHYPSDSEAGRVLAHDFVKSLFENEQFMKDFQTVKNEWAEKRIK